MATATIVLTGIVYLAALPRPTPTVLKGEVVQSANDRISTRGGAIPRHLAFIKVAKGDILVEDPNRKPDMDLVINGNANAEAYVYLLHNETVAISGFSNATLDFPTPGVSDTGKFQDTVTKVEDFCPTCRLQASADFDSPDLHQVGANFAFDKGRVYARTMSRCSQTPYDAVPWKFDPEFGYPGFEQVQLPREVVVEYDVSGNLMLTTTALPGGTGARPFTLKFKNRKLEITVGSATIEDITGVSPPHSFDRTDHHFELYYYLLEKSNAAKHPLPVADTACPDFHRAGGVDCPPVQQ
jgi:hypothetical protein